MRATAEQEEIDGAHPEIVYEMCLSVSCIDESVDSTSKMLVSVMMSASLHLTRACVELKMLHTSGSLVVRTASVESQEAFKETNTAPHCSKAQIKM